MRKHHRTFGYVLALACFTILMSCVHNISTSDSNWRTYNSPYDRVWVAAIQAVPATGMSISSTDKAGGTIIAQGVRNPMRPGAAAQMTIVITEEERGTTRVYCTSAVLGQVVSYGANIHNVSRFLSHLDGILQ